MARKIMAAMLVLILVGTLLLAGCNVNIGTIGETNTQEKNEAIKWYNEGTTLGQQGKYSEAIECFDKAIALDPNFAYAWNYKGIVLKKLGKYAEAQECFNTAKELGYSE